MNEKYNRKPIHVSEGSCFFDGKLIFDAIKFKVISTPKVMTSVSIGDKTPNSRWGNTFEYKVEITRRRTTKWAKEVLKKYKKDGITPEFTLSGVQEDKDSDYYADNGAETVTAVGCVLTSDINLIDLDANGEWLEDVLTFNAKDVKFSN